MGPIVSALLKPASDDSGQWAMRNLQHLLQCMVVTVNAVMGNSPQDSTACVVVALEALLQRLTGMADKCASHTVLSGLLSSSAQSMQQHMRKEALPV